MHIKRIHFFMKHYFLHNERNSDKSYIVDERSNQHRFFNDKMPDLSIIPFYHPPGIYAISKKVIDISPLAKVEEEEHNLLEVYC